MLALDVCRWIFFDSSEFLFLYLCFFSLIRHFSCYSSSDIEKSFSQSLVLMSLVSDCDFLVSPCPSLAF
jgi:hypothetical protein